jgi:hypothetical protein
MKRSLLALAAAVAALAVLPGAAHAKVVMSLVACGSSGCIDVTESGKVGHAVLDGSAPIIGPSRAEPFLRLRYGIGDGKELVERFTTTFLPASGLIRNADGTWMRMDPDGVALLRTRTRGLEPFAASRLELPAAARRGEAAPAAGAPAAPDDGGGLPAWVLISAAVAVALAALALALVPAARARRAPAG